MKESMNPIRTFPSASSAEKPAPHTAYVKWDAEPATTAAYPSQPTVLTKNFLEVRG